MVAKRSEVEVSEPTDAGFAAWATDKDGKPMEFATEEDRARSRETFDMLVRRGHVDGKTGRSIFKFSVAPLEDGRQYVNIDDVPTGFRTAKTINDKKRIVSKYIRERWIGKIIDEEGVRAFVNGTTADEYVYPAKKLNDIAISDKLDAASELDAIVATSTNPTAAADGEDGHVHKGVREWEYRDVLFSVDGRLYSGKVNIKILEKKITMARINGCSTMSRI